MFCLPTLKRTDASRLASKQQGFTLLELLVVIALLAMAVGLVAPAAVRSLEAARERGLASDLTALLEGLPVRAFRQGTLLRMDDKQLRESLPDLPADWRLSIEGDALLQYGAVGVARGGQIRLQAPGREAMLWQVSPITGEVKRLP